MPTEFSPALEQYRYCPLGDTFRAQLADDTSLSSYMLWTSWIFSNFGSLPDPSYRYAMILFVISQLI